LFNKIISTGMFDKVDRQILSQLVRDGRASYKRLGEVVGYTPMGVKRRVEKLLSQGVIRVSASLNVDALRLYTALIFLEIESGEALDRIMRRFEECPRIVYLFSLLSGYNLAALVIAEDRDTLESESMERCSLRSQEGVRRTEFYPIGEVLYSPYLPIRIDLMHRGLEIAPCGAECGGCSRYQAGKCVGCPATKFYRGPL